MAKWVNSSVLDNGPNSIKTQAATSVKMLLISAYTAGDSFLTVVGNKLNEGVLMADTDFAFTDAAGSRVMTVMTNGKSDAATASALTPDLHIAFTDGTANVLWVTDETSNQPITTGNIINFPAANLTYTSNQPT